MPDLKPPIGANRVANKVPYTDEELQRIINACDQVGTIQWSNGLEQRQVYLGEDLKNFIWMMVYTGLRISDIGLFHIDRLKGNEVFLRAKKNGGDVFVFILNGCVTGSMTGQSVAACVRLSWVSQTSLKPSPTCGAVKSEG